MNHSLQPASTHSFAVQDYDLGMTLASGQAFRWRFKDGGWEGVIGNRWIRLRTDEFSIQAEAAERAADWSWLTNYLQLDLDIREVIRTFPNDEPMKAAATACRGLRLLRQDPWECLASFILSSTKQIVQIQQIIELLTHRFGEPLPVLPGYGPAYAFPSAARLARATEQELRACKMGFRAPNLLKTARAVMSGEIDLEQLRHVGVEQARAQLLQLAGVGRKVSDCVLLFAYGYQSAFPVDVWVMKALRQLYFPRRRVRLQRLHRFAAEHFGPWSGYAQQYLFHYARTRMGRKGLAPRRTAQRGKAANIQ
jgi:N-glycosylase/DNA lyase